MVSKEKIEEKFCQLNDFLELLRKIKTIPLNAFLKDKLLIGSAKYYLQVSIECCLDIANHIIAAERFRSPNDYADSFAVLEEMSIINKHLGFNLRQMVKFRNRLVHLYGEVDDVNVYKYIENELKDISEFKAAILVGFVSANELKA
jgi:uncharacterized protein YutE (UPF0331/DUF86 family)